jgi:hypothetical protein
MVFINVKHSNQGGGLMCKMRHQNFPEESCQ